jgi:hypothetical protein
MSSIQVKRHMVGELKSIPASMRITINISFVFESILNWTETITQLSKVMPWPVQPQSAPQKTNMGMHSIPKTQSTRLPSRVSQITTPTPVVLGESSIPTSIFLTMITADIELILPQEHQCHTN